MDLNFFYAKQKHRMWKIRMKAHCLGIEEMAVEQIASAHQCDLGKWIDSYAAEKYKDLSEMDELIMKHDNLHNLAKLIVEKKKAGDMEACQREFKTLEQHSTRIVELLDFIEVNQK